MNMLSNILRHIGPYRLSIPATATGGGGDDPAVIAEIAA
jgi:hypothetical protein